MLSSWTVATSDSSTGVGNWPGAGVAPGAVTGCLAPTMRPAIWSIEVSLPSVETGMRVPLLCSWPDGMVMLLAWSTPMICWTLTPDAASLVGSRVTVTCGSRLPVRSAVATPSIDWISGTISFVAICATPSRPSWLVAAIEAMTTGDELMFSALTVGTTDCGRPRLRMFCSIAVCVAFTSVPKENWATTRATELADVERRDSRRGTPWMAVSMGLATCSATSVAPAPGYGATTVMTGKSMSGRSSCFNEPQAEMPATKRAKDSRIVTLRWLTAICERRLTSWSPWAARVPP